MLRICTRETLLQHAIVVADNRRQFPMEIEQSVMLAHRLTIASCQLRAKSANAVIQLLNLRLSEDRSRWLVLQSVDESGEEMDILCFHRAQLVRILGQRGARRGRVP